MCELNENGVTDQFIKQTNFLLDLQNDENQMYIKLLQVKQKKQSPSTVQDLLNICEYKLNSLHGHVFSESYFLMLDPPFMLGVIKEYIHHMQFSKKIDNTYIYEILGMIIKSCPGLKEALFLLAKIQFISGDIKNALTNVEKLLNNTVDSYNEAYLLMSQIQIHLGFYETAAQNLEVRI